MRFNEKELINYSSHMATKEGRVYYKNPSAGFREGYKERWFKLVGNLLYCFRVNEYGGVIKEPISMLIIENCKAIPDDNASLKNSFSIIFDNEPDKKHTLSCPNERNLKEWITCINEASYQKQREQLDQLRGKIMQLTGNDPINSFSFK